MNIFGQSTVHAACRRLTWAPLLALALGCSVTSVAVAQQSAPASEPRQVNEIRFLGITIPVFSFPGQTPSAAPAASSVAAPVAPATPASVEAPAPVAAAPAPVIQGGPIPGASPEVSLQSSYRLSAGDVVSIRVFGEDDMTLERVRLTDGGSISYPLLGELKILGMTVPEVEKLVTDKLRGRFLVNPKVAVQINEYRSFFVNGQVERPGGYPFLPGLSVRKAVALAGGLKERASKSKMYVIRENDPSRVAKKVDMDSLLSPGDILTIEESLF